MKKLKKLLNSFFAVLARVWIFLTIGSLLIITVVLSHGVLTVYLNTYSADEVPLVDVSARGLQDLYEIVQSETFDISTDAGMGRTHRRSPRTFLTNHHVVQGLHEIPGPVMYARLTGNNTAGIDGETRPLDPVACLEILDICILRDIATHDTGSPGVPEDAMVNRKKFSASSKVSEGEEAFVLPSRYDFPGITGRLLSGTVKTVHGPWVELSLFTRHGYSGSPVFNVRGEVVGYVSELNTRESRWRFLTATGATVLDRYVAGTRMVTAEAADSVLHCGRAGTENRFLKACLETTLRYFVEEAEHVLRNSPTWFDFFELESFADEVHAHIGARLLDATPEQRQQLEAFRDLYLVNSEEHVPDADARFRKNLNEPPWLKAALMFKIINKGGETAFLPGTAPDLKLLIPGSLHADLDRETREWIGAFEESFPRW